MLGGLAFLMYGMRTMTSGLEQMVGGKLEGLLKKMTSSTFRGLLFGTATTAIIQSSGAVTVMLVGLVNSGIMELGQTYGVLLGTNIGTTITAWMLSLVGLEASNVFIRLLEPESFAPIFALIGIIMIKFLNSKGKKTAELGSILIGFAILMSGMTVMKDSLVPLAEVPAFRSAMTWFSNPVLGILVGTVVTALIQSSTASVGILQSIALTGTLSFSAALPIIMGQNIGTCVTSVISSIGTNKNAKRVTVLHIPFNVIPTIVWIVLFYARDAIFKFPFTNQPISIAGIAFIHTAFNVTGAVMMLPFKKITEKLTQLIIPDEKGEEEKFEILDRRLLATPSFAIAECRTVTIEMGRMAKNAILSAIDLIKNYDADMVELITKSEEDIDLYEDKLSNFLLQLNGQNLSNSDNNSASQLLQAIGDFERIGDHAVNLIKTADEINKKGIQFSEEATIELDVITDAVEDILELTFEAFEKNDIEMAMKVEPLEEVIDGLKHKLKKRHVKRLKSGRCTIELGFVFSDLLTNYKRVSGHCSNIAVYVIQSNDPMIEEHEYIRELKASNDPKFSDAYKVYKTKYVLPESVDNNEGVSMKS